MDVIISEPRGYFRRWADQFVQADSQNRAVVVFRPRGNRTRIRAQAQSIFDDAASQAGRGGRVVVSVGHGGAGGTGGVISNTSVGMVDLAPRNALRLQRANVFYGEQRGHDERTLQEIQRIGAARCRRLRRIPERRVRGDQAFDYVYCVGAPGARERLAIRNAFDSIGRSLRSHRVREVILLTCRVGSATAFVDKIAADWGVRITAYRRRVAGNQDSGGKYRVYLHPDAEGTGTNTNRARTELPNRERYTTTGTSRGR